MNTVFLISAESCVISCVVTQRNAVYFKWKQDGSPNCHSASTPHLSPHWGAQGWTPPSPPPPTTTTSLTYWYKLLIQSTSRAVMSKVTRQRGNWTKEVRCLHTNNFTSRGFSVHARLRDVRAHLLHGNKEEGLEGNYMFPLAASQGIDSEWIRSIL